MSKPKPIKLALLCLSIFLGPGCTSASTQHADLTIVNARVYTQPEVPPLPATNISIRDGKIVAIYSGEPIKSDTIIDVAGQVATAGLWNSHVHLTDPRIKADGAQIVQDMLLRYGFTSVVDTGSELSDTLQLIERIERRDFPGPRIITANGSIVFKDGTPSYLPNVKLPEIEHPEQAEALVAHFLDSGANGIKIFSGSFQSPTATIHIPPDIIRAIVSAAHSRGSFVVSHPTDRIGLTNAIENGVDVLAHTAPPAGPLGPRLVATMKKNNVALIPTLKLWMYELERAGRGKEEASAYQNLGVEQLAEYVAANGEILFGTDVGYMKDFDTGQEFALMSKAGMDFHDILASLTTNPSKRFSSEPAILAVGLPADITLFKDDPSLDVTSFTRVSYTIKSGRVAYRSD